MEFARKGLVSVIQAFLVSPATSALPDFQAPIAPPVPSVPAMVLTRMGCAHATRVSQARIAASVRKDIQDIHLAPPATTITPSQK